MQQQNNNGGQPWGGIKYIINISNRITWVMPKGWDSGAPGVPRGSKKYFSEHGYVAYQIDGDDERNRTYVKN